ncbi:SGNH/GDSL hydrolase family protein [Agriterribacter sp.]|uniref:SGNH/GDSL hydrolase family protein n=1 Tax=Agriterribacter sp. TaxID=2821509 RepID=UPI002BCDDBD6|nr:GDSL-type esterase/lipase family protein [Agriterribacter sp.]HTN06508.1 GDSL-type esterase/lipase family protein [Agriterribacter sp.]
MKNFYLLLFSFFLTAYQIPVKKDIANPATYLDEIKTALKKEWPNNRTVNLVFHGHSVPAGYFKTPVVNTPDAYPYQVLKALKTAYPYAVINIINTSIGGENAESGAKRFATDVLIHKPDVLFIDYALNDRGIGLDKAKASWENMIKQAQEKNIKIILLTPSPDTSVHIMEPGNVLEKHALQIKSLAKKYGIGLADSYAAFKQVANSGDSMNTYMAQINHPNEKGHALIAEAILKYFIN